MDETVTLSTEEWNIIASVLTIDVLNNDDRFTQEYEKKISDIIQKIDTRDY